MGKCSTSKKENADPKKRRKPVNAENVVTNETATTPSVVTPVCRYKVPLYSWDVHVYVCTLPEFIDAVREEYGLDVSVPGISRHDVVEGLTVFADYHALGYPTLVWFPDYTPGDLNCHSRLVHESLHVAHHILEVCGVYLGDADHNREALAYLLEDIFSNITKRLEKAVKCNAVKQEK